MVIDESMQPRSSPKEVHQHPQRLPYNPAMFAGGPGPNQYYMYQQMPVRSLPSGSPQQGHVPTSVPSTQGQGQLHAKYEPLSDEENN
jgi:hypothetical protein